MQGMILAAGMGKRLKDLTRDNTKCMVKVNGVSLIDRMLHQLERHNLSRIVIVVGYKGELLKEYIATLGIKTPIVYVENPIYDKTNNIYSLALAKDYLAEQDTVLLESDLIFEDGVLDALIDDPRDTLALVDKYQSWMDGTCVKIDENDRICAFVPGSKFEFKDANEYYKTVNIYKFSKDFSCHYYIPFLDAYSKALGDNEYYEQVLRVITMLDDPTIKAKRLDGQLWYEIDDIQDLDIAESIFTTDDDKKLDAIASRYGGYWRYPNLLDFCYLVNPYFPPERMLDEIKASFNKLITQYPSGMKVNSLLVAKNFGVERNFIAVGNGAAELINALSEKLNGKTGVIRPTFEEYPNRLGETVVYQPVGPDYRYGVNDIIEFFADKEIKNLVLINPDNPSGNYIERTEVLRLASWCAERKIRLVLDESFVDFADEENSSLIHNDVLENNKNLIVVKSISKSFGVPGLRLGVIASANTGLIDEVKAKVSIWNINSFAEFYLQIYEKYKKAYEVGMANFREERKRFQDELSKIEGLRVIPSQANYFMVELTGDNTARDLARELLSSEQIFVKDLSKKTGNDRLLRIAIRDESDNNKLINALSAIMEKK